jgi:hypothetical protein
VTVVCTYRTLINVFASHTVSFIPFATFTLETSRRVCASSFGVAVVQTISTFINVYTVYPVSFIPVVTFTFEASNGVRALGVVVTVISTSGALVDVDAPVFSIEFIAVHADTPQRRVTLQTVFTAYEVAMILVSIQRVPIGRNRNGFPCSRVFVKVTDIYLVCL